MRTDGAAGAGTELLIGKLLHWGALFYRLDEYSSEVSSPGVGEQPERWDMPIFPERSVRGTVHQFYFGLM